MLDQNKLCEHLNYNAFLASLGKLEHTANPEVIHDLRLQLKGIRTLMLFCHQAYPKTFKQKKHISEIKLLFNQLGYIRDLYQSELLAVEFFKNDKSTLKAFQSDLKTKRKKAERELIILVNLTSTEIFRNQLIRMQEQINKWVEKDRIIKISEKFIKSNHNRINNLAEKNPINRRMHDIRKRLKRVHLVFEALNPEESKKSIKELESQIGRLCDLRILKMSLHKFILNYDQNSDSTIIEILDHINKEIKSIRNEAIEKLRANKYLLNT